MPKQIHVEIDLNGEALIKVTGVKGEGCKQMTAGLERALGKVTSDTPTAEMKEINAEARRNVDAR